MKIAYTMAAGRGDTDLLLSSVARRLSDTGLRVCGTVQINSEREMDDPCDMDVKVLPDGPVIRISQALGKHSRGWRLDIAYALVKDITVLVGLNQLNLEAFKEFAGGLEIALPPKENDLFDWLEENCALVQPA